MGKNVLLKYTASYNEEVASVVLENASKNASYTSHSIQKEILSVYASKIQKFIRAEIGDEKFCIIVDESRDESKREQMAIILRFVDKDGFVRERFFDIVHVEDTKAATLKNKISEVLSYHNLSIQSIRGQGYDGSSNMRGEWHGLQALFLNECPYAYYIHCFAHRLQLILVATSQKVIPIEHFFSQLLIIINVVDSSAKRHDQLQIAQAIRIEELTSTNQLETGRGKNQIGSLQRPGDTRWSSHLNSMHSLLKMFDSVLVVLGEIINDRSAASRAVADKAYDVMMSFEFAFVLHFLIDLLGRANDLCRMLQCISQDIVNAIDAVSNTKEIIQKFRENGWSGLLEKVKRFCEQRDIEIPDMNGVRRSSRGRAPNNLVTWEHHYRVDIFYGTIDCILQELGFRFKEDAIELLKLSSSLDPRRGYELFSIDDICKLVEKYYPADFSSQDKLHLKYQLELYELDIRKSAHFQHVETLPELCQLLSKTGKSAIYYLVDRLIRLILTLPVSTATSERAFSAMKIVKTSLRNKMEDDFLSSSLIMFIEREIAQSFDVDSIIDEFDLMKTRRSQLKIGCK
ncbi:uncharacterized protein LOC131018439 [Salvia miltiorrhiza]|uniref:uncharacterized protein LOC131018439 n=1 Tax=Salvia miltiorrhiza TaxID=226208 RepID=UPI0025AC114E|nr:uncharacterized protein LOC131018439 [Salvia miltiorrhiza]